jgi:hypothetical protein
MWKKNIREKVANRKKETSGKRKIIYGLLATLHQSLFGYNCTKLEI